MKVRYMNEAWLDNSGQRQVSASVRRACAGVEAAGVSTMFTTSVPHPTRILAGDKADILVVDDDSNLLRMLQRSLVFAGHTVRVAEDGVNALRLALEQEPDLVVLDVMLPEPVDGLEVARRLRD